MTIAAATVVAVSVAWLAADTVRGLADRLAERPGTVTVSRCEFHNFGRHADSYSCVGEFTSDDGDLRVPRVTFIHTGALDPGALVPATVSGPDDGTASTDAGFALGWRLAFGAAGVAALAALVRQIRRLRPLPHRHRRLRRPPGRLSRYGRPRTAPAPTERHRYPELAMPPVIAERTGDDDNDLIKHHAEAGGADGQAREVDRP